MSPSRVEAPSLAHLAELIHRGAADAPATIVSIAQAGERSLDFGFLPVTAPIAHPADLFIGMVADRSWTAVGLVIPGQIHALPGPAHPGLPTIEPGRAQVTVLLGRDGEAASVFEGAGGELVHLGAPPSGWVADAMARVFERPTPPPAFTIASWIEAAWLDRIAGAVFAEPDAGSTWAQLLTWHPVVDPGGDLCPQEAAGLTIAASRSTTWARLRRLLAPVAAPYVDITEEPLIGRLKTPVRWFDDGTFARWLMRNLPPAEHLLQDLIEALPLEVGDCLQTALTTVSLDRDDRHDDGSPDDDLDLEDLAALLEMADRAEAEADPDDGGDDSW